MLRKLGRFSVKRRDESYLIVTRRDFGSLCLTHDGFFYCITDESTSFGEAKKFVADLVFVHLEKECAFVSRLGKTFRRLRFGWCD
jgi:hypothetical protein